MRKGFKPEGPSSMEALSAILAKIRTYTRTQKGIVFHLRSVGCNCFLNQVSGGHVNIRMNGHRNIP
jgi:hypothetical protein